MSDFAGELDIDANAIIDRLTEVKEAIQETFSGGKDLEFQFPQGAYTTADMFPWQQEYKLQWSKKKLVRYQSAYVTFTRAAINPLKGKKATSTMIDAIKQSEGLDDKQAEQLIEDARKTASDELKRFYVKKYTDLFDLARKKPAEEGLLDAIAKAQEKVEEAQTKVEEAEERYKKYEERYPRGHTRGHDRRVKLRAKKKALSGSLSNLQAQLLAAQQAYDDYKNKTQEELDWDAIVKKCVTKHKLAASSYTDGQALGEAVATAILAHPGNSEKLSEMFMQAVYNQANEQLAKTHKTGDKESLAANKLASQLQKAWYRSVVVAYEISYWLYEINKGEAKRRMEKQLFKLEATKNEYKNKVNKDLKDLLANLTALQANPLGQLEGPSSTPQNTILLATELKSNLESEAKELLSRKAQIDAEYEKAKKKIDADHAKIQQTMDDEKNMAIGNFTVAPVGSRGKLRTGIKWHNTSAAMSARVSPSATGAITVMLSFSESTKGLGSFGHERHRDGFITIKPGDERPDGDGDIGKQFNKLLQTYA